MVAFKKLPCVAVEPFDWAIENTVKDQIVALLWMPNSL